VEAIGIGIVALGPIAAVFLMLLASIRRRRPADTDLPTQRPMAPPSRGGGDFGGDRYPRRPLTPVLSGGAALPLPDDDEVWFATPPARHLPRRDDRQSDRRAG
jgi:hypothetical protein